MPIFSLPSVRYFIKGFNERETNSFATFVLPLPFYSLPRSINPFLNTAMHPVTWSSTSQLAP
jgi:hypothetical protein